MFKGIIVTFGLVLLCNGLQSRNYVLHREWMLMRKKCTMPVEPHELV